MEIRLYKDKAPGSENWTWKEASNNNNSVKVMTVYNVVHPTLTVFLPDPHVANGTAVIICPGGGFHFLAIDHEGNDIARSLAKKGITAFVLKYRLVRVLSDNPFDDMLNAKDQKAWDDEALPVIPLAIMDGRQAIAYVRSHAAAYRVNPQRIGIMGFSAGGMLQHRLPLTTTMKTTRILLFLFTQICLSQAWAMCWLMLRHYTWPVRRMMSLDLFHMQ